MDDNKNIVPAEAVDAALDVLREAKNDSDMGEVLDLQGPKKLLRKLDFVLMPMILGTWLMQSLDKTTLGAAAIFDIRQETHLVGTEYSWLGSMFFLGWIVFEYPATFLLQRFPVGKVLAALVTAWGAVLMCHAACSNFAGLATVRTLLGAFEAGCNPACMVIFGMFYTRAEQPFRMGIWIGFGGVAYILGGIISYGIGHIQSALSTWKILYLIYGSITICWGVFLWVWIPDSPLSARFLTEEERKAVVLRIAENGTGLENKHWKKAQASQVPGIWVELFQGIIILSLGYTGLQTTLMTMPSGAVQIIGCTAASYFASRFKNLRIAMSLLFILPFLVGSLGLRLFDDSRPWGRLVCLWLCFFFASPYGIGMALVNANTAGHTKRITTNAMYIIGAGTGSFMGPFFFKSNQEPYYSLGFDFMFVTFSCEVAVLVGLFAVLWTRNRSRRLARGNIKADVWGASQNGFLDLTDIENEDYEYVY
ncbi:hypothetical protein BP5796_08284 [Coleophoma crateriformis]|uniref:Major facilitator superfamily (MFS) profile domain-containing protein n=1 Tax=Coleophoma crateriformis TaxID=565419 RepID=A0A3D8R796_9HELO|nr:hypothetical protein BP5796_08284 [Coleophoma crateriformis]